jgi:dTDP-glucose 4,6-dehydratase
LDWKQEVDVEEGLKMTIKWYMNHPEWVDRVKSGEYNHWVKKNYKMR